MERYAEGRICAVGGPTGMGSYRMVQYIYDAEGTRVAKGNITNWSAGCDTTQNGFTPTNSYVLGLSNEQVTETDGNGNWLHTNVFAAGMLITTYGIPPTQNPALHFQLEDWLGTRRVQTDISGNVEERYTSLPFGDGLTTSVAGGLHPPQMTRQNSTSPAKNAIPNQATTTSWRATTAVRWAGLCPPIGRPRSSLCPTPSSTIRRP